MAMAEEQKTKQVIEITTHPKDGRMELEKMANSMLAIKSDYQQWLKKKKEKPRDADLSLYVERVERGSIKLLLGKCKEIGDSLPEYGLEFFEKVKSVLKEAHKWARSEQRAMLKFFSSNKGCKMEVKFFNWYGGDKFIIQGNPIFITPKEIVEGHDFLKGLLATKKETHKGTPIRFTQYNTETGSAKIIARKINPNGRRANLLISASVFLSGERENIFHKEYTADVTVYRIADSKEIFLYTVREIAVPKPPAIPSNAGRKE